MDWTQIVGAFIDLGFPVAVTVFLLVQLSKDIREVRRELILNKIGLYLLLEKHGVVEEYQSKINQIQEVK